MIRNTIRKASPEDAFVIVDIIRAAAQENAFHSRVLSVKEFREFAFEKSREGYNIFVCKIRGTIVGYIDSRMRMGVGHILGLYVKPTYRRKGIGRNLMETMVKEFKKKGCHKTRLEVFANNDGAIDFYNRLGFVQEGYFREDEEKKDTIVMSKVLTEKRKQES
jgi:ribosomal protein S18 acetylase RimI-like enzyme